jgi:hypothetical protein
MPIHSSKLERYLSAEEIAQIQRNMGNWYGPSIPIARVPGNVRIRADGDFEGRLAEGRYSTLMDRTYEHMRSAMMRASRRNMGKLNAGFTSLSDLISEATAGAKRREFQFTKNGATGVAAVTNSLWGLGNMPPAGADGSAAPGGRSLTDATTGAFPFTNPSGGDTQHFVTGYPSATVAGNTLLLYDRIFDVAKTMNSTATESVTGVPTRYQSSTATAADYAGGNFAFVEVGGTALAATAHNWTVCQYRNQAGTDAQSFPSMTGNSGAIARRLDHPSTSAWFMPLNGSDTGVMDFAQMQCSALVATGVINFVIGHPIAWLPCPVVNMICVTDGLNSAFNLSRVFDDAALAFLEVNKPSTSSTNYAGSFATVAG